MTEIWNYNGVGRSDVIVPSLGSIEFSFTQLIWRAWVGSIKIFYWLLILFEKQLVVYN